MRTLKLLPRTIIKKSFNLSVRTIEQFYDMTPYNEKVKELRKMPKNTLGNDIAKCLDDNHLSLVPNFESHDLKHVLLKFKMTPVDEIRMQAFMLGNGNYSILCFVILLFGALLLPAKWPVFYRDYLRGRHTSPISSWTIDDYAHRNTNELRRFIFGNYQYKQQPITIYTLTKYSAIAAIVTGIAGMIFCLPFLFSSSIADLVGAGFPFVGGAILTIGGLLALSNLAGRQPAKIYL